MNSVLVTIVVLEAVALLVLAVLVYGLLRSHALILRSLHELGAGLDLEREVTGGSGSAGAAGGSGEQASGPTHVDLERGVVTAQRDGDGAAYDIVGTDLAGDPATVLVRPPGQRTLLAFLTSGCSVCETFWEEFRPGDVDVPGRGRLVVVAKGPADESASALQRLAGERTDVVQSAGAWSDYAIPGSPYFVYVEGGVVTGEGSATTWPQVRDLMAQAVADSEHARAAAGRAGPGGVGGVAGGSGAAAADGIVERGARDDLGRIDRELLDSGITPRHPSLYTSPDETPRP